MGGGAVLGRLVRGAFLLTLAVMIAAYAVSGASSSPPELKIDQPAEMWYC
jgi:hypothetical protein